MNKIIERIEREVGIPNMATILAQQLSPTDLQSLLLEVYRQRASQLKPADVLSSYQHNRFVRPSAVPAITLFQWEWIAFARLPAEFQILDISPVCPLGTNSIVSPVDQNWSVTTIRNTEVVSDSSTVLALECALRRRELLRANPRSTQPVHLATNQRILRAQNYQNPKLVSHFSAITMCSAGRDTGSYRFESSALDLQIRFYLSALSSFLGPYVALKVSITNFGALASNKQLKERLFDPIHSEFDNVDCVFNDSRTSGLGYYLNLCFHIHAAAPSGHWVELVDGGTVDWTQKYLSSAKEKLIISGIGSERVCTEFGTIGLAPNQY
jgi:hypothetical protein